MTEKRKDRIINKLRQTAAFTLAEALVATIIMLLVTSIMVAGIPAAIRAYDNVVVASNAEVLMSTAMSELRNELTTARDISVDNNEVTFYNERAGFTSRIYCEQSAEPDDDDSVRDIMYQRYYSSGGGGGDDSLIDDVYTGTGSDSTAAEKLISDAASDKKNKLHVEYESVSYEPGSGYIKFENIKVKRKNGSDTKAFRDEYLIRVISD
ncbi:MAG: hypothetical protein IJJ03_08210 [Mogibacterium sp.]|nr:hypothetical protein [Mogibacterium sp.]MBR0380014.1 hypothetical protein [Mogibacterium sp.]